jgi:glycosyltransferase involved in cell wall biosynthesis
VKERRRRPLISVVMPVRNGEAHLAEAIRSIQGQTIDDWELILADNSSSDSSVEIAAGFARADSRVHVIDGIEGDRAAAKNAGIALSRGTFLARMDADDISVPERFAIQLAWLERTGADMCGGWAALFGILTGLLWFPEHHDAVERELLFRPALLGPATLARRDTLAEDPYSETAALKDYELLVRLARRRRLGNAPAVLLRWRRHPGQSHLLEPEVTAAESRRLGAEMLLRLYPDAGDEDIAALDRVAARVAADSLEQLALAGEWLVRLADSPDPMLQAKMQLRWQNTCRRTAQQIPGTEEIHRRFASKLGIRSTAAVPLPFG